MSKMTLPAWDLSDLYQGLQDPKIEQDLEIYKTQNEELAKKYKGKIADLDAKSFADAIRIHEKTVTLSNFLMDYAYLNMVTQMKNTEAMAFYQNISEKLTDYSLPSIFFTLEINQLEEEKIHQFLQNDDVKHYEPWLKRVRLFKDYELSPAVEEILHEKNVTSSSAWVRLYEETSARLKYVVDGKSYNDAEIGNLLHSKDASLRHKAGAEINKVSKENAELFSFIYNMVIKDKAIEDNKRGYRSPIASKNLVNQVEDEVVVALADSVKENYAKIAHRFYKLKAKWLGVDEISYWDRNAPLPFEDDTKYDWDRAKKIVLEAYERFSPKLHQLGEDFFTKSWIDVPPRDGKRNGAFAAPVSAELHPYLLLNFQERQSDVLTLAHELGHGCHQRLSGMQGEINDATPLTLAEVASVFGEMITFQSLMQNLDDDKAKLCLIASKVNDMINTAIRQIAFHFFETRVHEERKNGELSIERINQIWVEEMKTSLGEAVKVGDDCDNVWSQVGHFYFSPFYVYAYSFADCLVNSLYQVYRAGEVKDFEQKYLHMLSETGVKKYDELLKPFGLDAKDKGFWNKGLSLISEYIDELERLDGEIS